MRKIICIDTGVIYRSITDASKQIGCTPQWIWLCIKNKTPHKGKMYEYYDIYDDEIPEVLELENKLQQLRKQHPEYNKVTMTMSTKEYANYLKSRKEVSL